jgi:phosphate starvation-inducible PhoH-like protein
MAKRSTVRRLKAAEIDPAEFQRPESERTSLYAIPGGWSPANDAPARGRPAPSSAKESPRDQRYMKTVKPRSEGQRVFMEAIDNHNLVLALGPAGTGKTYLAITKAVEALEKGQIGRIVLSRPAVEAGETLGFLPGDMEEKLAPYLRPLYDALQDRLSPKQLKAMMAEGLIEIAPIGFMRGRTLNNAFVVIDEAQNCTYVQIKMLLTRLGWNSTMVVTGDPMQSDLLHGLSGLGEAAERLAETPGVGIVRLAAEDVVRHPLVATMLEKL